MILGAVAVGIAAGYWLLPEVMGPYLNPITTTSLYLLLFGIGIDLGRQREVWGKLWSMGWKVLLLPVLVALGSLAGAAVSGLILGLPFNESTAIGAGFGWYSLSGVLIAEIYHVETGALAFMTNVARELLTFLSVPLVARYIGRFSAVAPGGATTMDTTLPLITKATDADMAVIAFINGSVLSTLVPLLVPFFIHLKF
ncbi:lysine exporter LysO family protein [Desulforamulus ruminis]|uniref:lysine exporter LysO family protein n=1 Tax=Desulforamulus ruminis TaxID=1564 RepID=UPI001EE3CD4B|nr:lysine exporter LysO family protein [Desulforamulus ruminis]